MKRLRVGLILNSLTIGGAEQHVLTLCRTVDSHRVELRLFLLLPDVAPILGSEIPPNTSVEVTPYRRHDPRVLVWLSKGFKRERVDVVHSFLWYADFVAALSKALLRWQQPLICSERGDRGAPVYTTRMRVLDRFVTFPVADAFCTNSMAGERALLKAGAAPRRIHVIPNGVEIDRIERSPDVDLRSILSLPTSAQIVGVVARLVRYKGLDSLLRAFARFLPQRDLYCVIIGDGPARVVLERMTAELGLEGRVFFLGLRVPVESFVKDFDVAVLPTRSDTEHCSNSILEYMACRRPVVATRVSGNDELVLDGETGYLVKADDVEALARRISDLLDNRGVAQRMGERGRNRVESKFNMVSIAERLVNLWQAV